MQDSSDELSVSASYLLYRRHVSHKASFITLAVALQSDLRFAYMDTGKQADNIMYTKSTYQ